MRLLLFFFYALCLSINCMHESFSDIQHPNTYVATMLFVCLFVYLFSLCLIHLFTNVLIDGCI